MIFTSPSLISEELATNAPSLEDGAGVDVEVSVGVAEGVGVEVALADADGVGWALALAVAAATFAPCFQTSFPLDLTTV